MKPDRNPVAAHQIRLATVLGVCVPERVERGVRSHPKSCRIRISNYFCLGTYEALRAKGQRHGQALRNVADRILRILMAMLRDRTVYDPCRSPPRLDTQRSM